MKFPPASLVTLVRLLRRDGFAFFGKCTRYAFSRDAWLWLLRGGLHTPPSGPFPASSPVRDYPPEEQERSRRILRNYAPEISVVVTSYNYAHLIRETLDALVGQTYPAHEILVVDNGSSDGSPDVVREYAARFPSVRLLQHEGCVNKGLPASVKLGVETATGEFVAFCEADDIWTPDHLEKKVELLRARWGEPNFIVNDFETFGDPDRCKEIEEAMSVRLPALAEIRNRIFPPAFRERNYIFTFSICMVRRSVLLACDLLSVPYPSNLDWWLWRQICFDNDVWVVHEKLTKWRLHGGSYLMREKSVDRVADQFELTSRMDRLLWRRRPALADSLLPFLRPEDRAECKGGLLTVKGVETAQPGFSVVLAESGRRDWDEATVASVADQTYANFELIVVSRGGGSQSRDDRMAAEGLAGRIRFVPAPDDADEESALEAGFANASREWIVPILSGDRLRPDALKTFAARIVLGPDVNGVCGIARTMVGGGAFGGAAQTLPETPPGPFACAGAFALRRFGDRSGARTTSRFSGIEARLADRFLSTPPTAFAQHIVLYRDDGPDGRDPEAKRLLGAMAEILNGASPVLKKPSGAEVAAIRRSPLFDADWYLRNNPDVLRAGVDPVVHYFQHGREPLRNPGPHFVGDEYLALNPDVRASGENPLVHLETRGRKEGRPYSFLQASQSGRPGSPAGTDGGSAPAPDYGLPARLGREHAASFPAKIAAIRRKRVERGLPVRALFLVSSPSMFPARPLFDAMLRDRGFDARILVVPDLRWWDRDPEPLRRACREGLSAYPAGLFVEAWPDEFGCWPDSIGEFDADIVCYPSPYDFSCFRYNPHWAVGRGFLPIYISYSFSTSLYGHEVFGLQNYAWFWKVFVECAENAKDYAEHSILGGSNAETVGYFKMDALATAKPWPRNGGRKRVLVAPHHSVEGGANDTLAFSNFQRYADFFLALPEKYPELDFVFRPHPFLFTVLARPSKWGQAAVDRWISRMKAHPNVRWSDEGDYFPAFASCDAAVHDCGSYLAEWFYTGKPCCYMLKTPADIDAKFAPLGKECLSHCYLAYEESEIEAFLRDVVEGGADPKAAARDEFSRRIMVNHPHAADAALASIKKAVAT